MGTGFASPRYHGFACSRSLGFPPALSTVLSINRTGRHTVCDLLNMSIVMVYYGKREVCHSSERTGYHWQCKNIDKLRYGKLFALYSTAYNAISERN